MKTLPDLDNCLVVFDEGHHLPAVALDQFSSAMDLSNLRWLDKLPKAMNEVAGKLALHVGEDVQTVTSQLKGALTTLARLAMDLVWAHTGQNARGEGNDGTLRFANGVLPDALRDPVNQIHSQAAGLSKALEALGVDVKAIAKDDPSQAVLCAQLYAQLGGIAPRLGSLVSTAQLLLEHGEQPLAKWLQAESENGYLTMTAHACPIVPGDLLRQFLWSQVRGAIVTSASLTSCGSFDYFLKEAGLSNKPYVTALDLPGALCETVFIAKLPFAPPSDPVDEARAEWLRSVGRDPFNELVIPATGVKLLQWTGRAIRTEEDRAQVICYDKRLTQTSYGKRMLAGLPAYKLGTRSTA
jgi:ATP-dependent DNA helicase DinG